MRGLLHKAGKVTSSSSGSNSVAVETLGDLRDHLEQDGEDIAAIELRILKHALDLIQNRLYSPAVNL